MRELTARQRQKSDTAAHWAAANPVLLAGELGFENDTGRFKFGDGAAAWQTLAYRGGVATVNGTAPDANGDVQVSAGGGGTPYRLVVQTQEEFDAMIATADWLGASSVLLAGTFTFTDPEGNGLLIPETVCAIEGVNGAEICAENDVLFVLRYETLPEDGLHRITGLTVRCESSGGGFSNMTGMLGCTAERCAVGFSACHNLVNCTANALSIGFSSCYSLTNCITRIGRASVADCFSNCSRLTNCTASIERGTVGTGFSGCLFLCNCLAELYTSSVCTAYQDCRYCTCCGVGGMSSAGVVWENSTGRCDATCQLTT